MKTRWPELTVIVAVTVLHVRPEVLCAGDRVNLMDFFPMEVGADYTFDGTFDDNGKSLPSSMTLKVTACDGFGDEFTWRYRTETIYGSRKLIESCEISIEKTEIRPMTFASHVKRNGDTHTYDAWTSLLPRVVEIGQSYRINDHFLSRTGGTTRSGFVRVSLEGVTTALGTFDCLCLTTDVDWGSGKTSTDLKRVTQEWYARDFGLVRFRVRTTGPGAVIERDVTVTSSSRPLVFNRAIKVGR